MGSRFDNPTFIPGSTDEVTVTSAAAAHTIGSWVDLANSLNFDICGFLLTWTTVDSTSSRWTLFHVATYDGATRDVLFYVPAAGRYDEAVVWGAFYPLALAKGTRVQAAVQDDSASTRNYRIGFRPIAASRFTGFGRIVCYGQDLANSRGTAVDAHATLANNKGSSVEVTTASGIELDARWAVVVAAAWSNNVSYRHALDLKIYDGTNWDVLVPDLYCHMDSQVDKLTPGAYSIPAQVAKDTRMGFATQASGTDATERVLYPTLTLLG